MGLKKLQVLFDLNVVLDVLQQRAPFYARSAQVLAAAESGRCQGFLSAHSITTLFYLYTKSHSASQARFAIGELLQFLTVAAVNQSVIEVALNLPTNDFEDAVQMQAAAEIGLDYVVTRNIKDYKHSPVPAIDPAELSVQLEQLYPQEPPS